MVAIPFIFLFPTQYHLPPVYVILGHRSWINCLSHGVFHMCNSYLNKTTQVPFSLSLSFLFTTTNRSLAQTSLLTNIKYDINKTSSNFDIISKNDMRVWVAPEIVGTSCRILAQCEWSCKIYIQHALRAFIHMVYISILIYGINI